MQQQHHSGRRDFLLAAFAALPTGLTAGAATAQPVDAAQARIVIGSPAGGALDFFARKVADGLQLTYAKSVLVENRTGASGQLAISGVKAAAADGNTILLTPSPMMAIYPHTYRKLPYDPVADFMPVSMAAIYDLAFAVGPAVPAAVKSIADFVAWCKAEPQRAQFGSPAAGSTPHFVGAMLSRHAKTEITHVPYRGTVPAITDMLGGQVAAACAPLGDFVAYVSTGRCRVLATTGGKRSKFAPDVPTFAEAGFKELALDDWWAFFVAAGTPPARVQQLNAALKTVLGDAALARALEERCLEPQWSEPAPLAANLRLQTAKWGPIVKTLGFTADS
jgi:tripartite-type tricarboxylate transporter receptor subunit TctC